MYKDKFYGFSTGELLELRDMWRELIRVVPWEGEDRDLYKRVFDKIHEINVCIANRIDEGHVELFVDYSNCIVKTLVMEKNMEVKDDNHAKKHR